MTLNRTRTGPSRRGEQIVAGEALIGEQGSFALLHQLEGEL